MARSIQATTNTEENEHLLMLPHKAKVGETRLKSLGNKIVYIGTKLASKFNIKDKFSKKHKHDLIYKANVPILTMIRHM